MNLILHPSPLTIGVGATLTLLDLFVAWRDWQRRWQADLWDVLVRLVLGCPNVLRGLEKARLVEVRRDWLGQVIELAYRGNDSGYFTDIAEFLVRHHNKALRTAVARSVTVTNPTSEAVDVFAGEHLLGTVDAQRTSELWLASSDESIVRFAWHNRSSSRRSSERARVRYAIQCQTAPSSERRLTRA